MGVKYMLNDWCCPIIVMNLVHAVSGNQILVSQDIIKEEDEELVMKSWRSVTARLFLKSVVCMSTCFDLPTCSL